MILENLLETAALIPDDVVLIDENGKVTYRELIEYSEKVAHRLSKFGVGHGDFVTVELPRNKKYVASLIGVWMVGAAFAALDVSYPKDRLDYIAGDCNAKVRITDSFFDGIDGEARIENIRFPKEDDCSLLVYTSGSTGKPKGVLHSHLSMSDMMERGAVGLDMCGFKRRGQIFGMPVPFSFIAGVAILFNAIIGGAPMYIIPSAALRDPVIMSKVIYENNVSIAYIPPKMIKVLENKGGVLKTIITGSERVTNTYRDDVTIINGFGASETGGGVTFFKIDKEYDNTPIGNTVGKEVAYVLDEDGNEVEEGELCVAGHFALGYYNLPEQTKEHFVPNPFKDRDGFDILYKTGDIVRRVENNNLVCVNRKDWMIKINGQRIEPGEIEGVIRAADGVHDAVVKDFVGAAGQTYIAAYYVVKEGKKVDEEDLKKAVGASLPSYMMPAYFVELEKLPINANGKLDRKALEAPKIAASTEYVAPRDDIEKELCAAFEKALNVPRVGANDDFFSLGGDSIRVMVLEQLCPGLKLSTKTIYEKRTVESIAEAVRNASAEEENIDIYNDSFPLNQAQLGIFLSCQQREGEIAYNNPILFRFGKDVDEHKLQAAIDKTIRNHPGLSATIFADENGLPMMKYSKEFASLEGCDLHYIKEEEFGRIKETLIRPFSIKNERLYRFAIFKSEAALHLFMDIHHIMFDGYSMKVLLPEIIGFYKGKEALPESFTAYHAALKESRERQSDAYAAAKEWYLKEFGEVEEVALPSGDRKGGETTFGEYKAALDVDPDTISEFCFDNHLTENAFTTAAFGCLLSIYTMNRKAAFATIYNGRHDANTKNTVSMFVRTLPVLCYNDAALKVVDYIGKVKDMLLGAMVNDTYSFRELVSSSGYSSDVLFTYQGDLFEMADLGELRAEKEDMPFNATGEKISIQVYPSGKKLIFDVQYHSNLYSEKWVKDFSDRYEKILRAFMTTAFLKDVSLIDKEEEAKILGVSYGGDLAYDKDETFVDMFLDQVEKHADKEAVVDANGSYTYRELDNVSNAIARYLSSHGVGKGEFVALKIGRVKEFYASILGAQKAGAAYVPVDPTYPEDRIEYMISDCEAKITLTEESVKRILDENADCTPVNSAAPALPAYMIYTSGSTGKPKGVVISHSALRCFIAWVTADYEITENRVHAEHASFSFDASVFDVFPPLANGATVHIISSDVRKDLDLTYKYIVDHKVTNMCMSTQIGMSLLNLHPDVPLDFILIGGEKFLKVEKTNVKIYNGYGPTEFTVCSSYTLVNQSSDKDVPIGKAVKNTYSLICDFNGNLLPLGMTGEICLAGPQISDGYYHREELNRERFIDSKSLPAQKMYRTGDLAKYNGDGELEYLGRIDFQVKLRGFRIELGEIENVASGYPNVKQAIALVKNKLLVLYYSGEGEIDPAALKAHMAESLTEYMVPNIFMRLDNMPLTPGGKIDRRALPEPEKSDKEAVAPRNEDEKKTFDLLSKILGYDDFGVTDDFGDIGLTSLGAMQFASMLSTAANKSIRVSDLVKYPTVEKLSEFICAKEDEGVHELQKDYPLTMAQHGILTEVLAHPDTTIYNVPCLIDLPQNIDLDRFEAAVVKAIDAHPYLKGKIISNEQSDFRIERRDGHKISVKRVAADSLPDGPQGLVKPFDLTGEDLTRAYLITSGDGNRFLFDAHHIIFDGESLDILLADINRAYTGNELIKETYSEYELALDEIKLHQGEALEEAKKYYGSLLDGRDTDCLPINDISVKGVGKREFNVSARVEKEKVEKFIKDNKTTINSMWIASLGFALAKYLNRRDAVLTTVYNGRNDVRVRNDVGMFVHTLPVAADPFKYENAREYVKATGDQIQKNMAHDIYGFMEIAHDYGVRADILFVYEGKISQGIKLDGYDIPGAEMLSLNEKKAELLIAISDIDDGFGIHVEYNGDKYEEWSMASFINSLIRVFNALADGRDISDISLLSDDDLKAIDEYNDTKVDVAKEDVVSRFRRAASRYPDNTAVIYKDKKYTYREVDALSDKIAFRLAGKGVGKGDVVSILIPRSENMVIATLGVLKTGAAYQPLDHSYPSDRLNFMIGDANAKMLIAEKELLEKIPGCELPTLLTEEFDSLSDEAASLETPGKDDLFILLYTSGTTGTPKGVMLTHFNLVNFCEWYRRYYDLKPDEVVSAYAGFGFDACMMDIYPALTTGAAVCIVPDEMRMNLDQLKRYFEENNVTHSFMTTQVGRMFATENDDCSLKYLSVGGEKLTPLDPPKGYCLINGYGPTECTIFSTTCRVDKMYHRIPIGKPLDNYKLYVVDSDGKQLPNGALGELWISGYGVGLGYLNQKEKTEQTFIKNPFSDEDGFERVYRTGDIVRRLADGSIDFVGRNDGQVKIRGFRIELGEVEMVIRSFDGIKDVTVQAFDLEAGGKFLAAYFTSGKKIDIAALKDHIKANKPAYMVPASIMQLESIPLNQNQKVNKRALPKPTFTDEQKEYVAPKNDVEKSFCDAYEEILGLEKVSADDNFFEIGGTSLTAAKVVIFALNNGYQISYQDIFAHPTPVELAEYVKGNKTAGSAEEKSDAKDSERSSLKYNDVAYVDEIRKERDLGKVLLAGANGFLGIHIFKELLDQKREMVILVRSKDVDPIARIKGLLMYYFDSALDDEFDNFVKVVDADITNPHLVDVLKDYEFDTIINSAAIVKHFSNDDSIERVNVGGVKNLIEVAKAHNARLIQISTLSVAGENVGHKFPNGFAMKENMLYFGQDLSNKYANSKFKAEEAILDAVENEGLDAKIIRLGNLMSRQKDGEFQINSVTNAFMRNLKGYKVLEKFPISALDSPADFSPIDETAKTILLLAQTPRKFTVFHSHNSHAVQMGDLIDAMDLVGMHIEKVSDREFATALREAMHDEKKSMIVSALLSYSSSDNQSHELITDDSTYSVKALYRLGYRWPITDFNYLIKAIEALQTLGFFEKDDI